MSALAPTTVRPPRLVAGVVVFHPGWALATPSGVLDVPDHTRKTWPATCTDRLTIRVYDSGHQVHCTRRARHGGRHAAGNGTHVVAVWPRGTHVVRVGDPR